MDYISRIRKRKKRQLLVLCASGLNSGLESLLLRVQEANWQILQSQSIHYPHTIKTCMQKILHQADQSWHLSDLALLDSSFTAFLTETAQKVIATVPKLKRHCDMIVLKKHSLWHGIVDNPEKQKCWNIQLGDAYPLAQALQTPVLTDFIRCDILAHGSGTLHLSYGDLKIAQKAGDIAIFVNCGIISDITVIDSLEQRILVKSDTGPGTCCIDCAAQDAGCDHGIDRDGTAALTGTVNTEVLEVLHNDPWFKKPSPKQGESDYFVKLYQHPCVRALSPADRLATMTAFTALTISNFYKRECPHVKKPEAIWLSGGGANNLTLVEFLKAYFTPLPVRTIEELGIPITGRIPLSLALTVQGYCDQKSLRLQDGKVLHPDYFGKWVLPHSR